MHKYSYTRYKCCVKTVGPSIQKGIATARPRQTLPRPGNNRLEELPGSFGKLSALRECDVNNNRMAFLPASFGHLDALEWLDASSPLRVVSVVFQVIPYRSVAVSAVFWRCR